MIIEVCYAASGFDADMYFGLTAFGKAVLFNLADFSMITLLPPPPPDMDRTLPWNLQIDYKKGKVTVELFQSDAFLQTTVKARVVINIR